MKKQHIHIGVENEDHGFERFIKAWHKAEVSKPEQSEVHFNFEDFSLFASILTPKRFELMRTLRQCGPLSISALAKQIERDYKNVHTDINTLAGVGLVQQNEKELFIVPWDVIDAHVRLVA